MEEGAKAIRKGLKEQLGEVTQVFIERGLSVKTIVMDGDPASQLIQCVAKETVDLMICGSRGVDGFESLLLGSVAHKLFSMLRYDSINQPMHMNGKVQRFITSF